MKKTGLHVTLWLFNITVEAMAHRKRWFTVLKNGGSFQFAMLNNQMVKLSRNIQSQHNPTIIHKIQPHSTKIPRKTIFCGLIPPSYDTWADLHKIIRSSPTLHQQYQCGTLVVRVYIYQLCTEHLRAQNTNAGLQNFGDWYHWYRKGSSQLCLSD